MNLEKIVYSQCDEIWHASCETENIGGRMVRQPVLQGDAKMFAHFESAQRVAVSAVGALFVAAVLFAAAVPVIPVA